MNNKRIAEVLYNLSCDIDYLDYTENLEGTINDITSALEHLKDLGLYNDDFNLLFTVIEQIAEVNENTRDFVNEIRTINE